jgi:hypothetical protein
MVRLTLKRNGVGSKMSVKSNYHNIGRFTEAPIATLKKVVDKSTSKGSRFPSYYVLLKYRLDKRVSMRKGF